MEKRLKKVIIIISVLFFLCFTSCGGHKPQEPSIDLSTLYQITDFGPTFRLKDENGTEYVSEEIDTDMLFGQMPDNKVEVGDIYAYMLVEGWKIAYVARVEGCDKNSLISGFEDGSGTISEKNFQAFWVNELYQQQYDLSDGTLLSERLIVKNDAIMMYSPFLDQGKE